MSPIEDDCIEFDSGPYCRHWSDPGDCTEACARCGHECRRHGGDECREDGCECREFEVGT